MTPFEQMCDEVDSRIARTSELTRIAHASNAADVATLSIAHSLHALTVMFRWVMEDEFRMEES